MITRARAGLLALTAAAVCGGALLRRESPAPLRLSLAPSRILADGYDTAVLSIEGAAADQPNVSVPDAHTATVEDVTGVPGKWQARIRAGVIPALVRLRVEFPGQPPATTDLTTTLDTRDTAGDGTPDFLRLQDEPDQRAFRRWFTFLAEAQYFQPASARPAEINDCAALIRYAYREALRRHDGPWADSASLPFAPAFDSVAKYQYPFTPLAAALFRVRAGPFRSSDLAEGGFLQFADAQTLWHFNTHALGRDLARALPGDLLFFRQQRRRTAFHSMIYLGGSQVHDDGRRYVVYHTGPEGKDPGEMRRLTLEELRQFPRAEWRPLASNPAFLGVSRWNILRKERQ